MEQRVPKQTDLGMKKKDAQGPFYAGNSLPWGSVVTVLSLPVLSYFCWKRRWRVGVEWGGGDGVGGRIITLVRA